MTASAQIQVAVCHECPLLQAGLSALLARHADFALDPAAAAPDVVIADDRNAAQLLARFRALPAQPRAKVLVVAHAGRESDIRAAMAAGVQGYLVVDDVPEHLAPAVRALLLGGRILSPGVASRLAESVAGEDLTPREQAVLALVIEGLCNKSIARQLDIASGTVKSHLRSAFGKLGVASRAQAVVAAHRRGLLQGRGAHSA